MDTHAVEQRRRNRSWPEAVKREIVAASLAPGSSVSVVARQYDVNANQVFSWRKRYRDERPRPAGAPQFIPVMVAPEQTVVVAPSTPIAERIEIEIAGKYRVRICGNFDTEVLRRVLDVLERR